MAKDKKKQAARKAKKHQRRKSRAERQQGAANRERQLGDLDGFSSFGLGSRVPELRGLPDGAHFNCDAAGFKLIISMRSPSLEEVAAFTKGRVELHLVVRNHALFVCARHAQETTDLWHDAPFSIHKLARRDWVTPDLDLPPSQGSTLVMVLADPTRGEVLGLRFVGMAHDFSVSLAQAIQTQMVQQFSDAEHDAAILHTYARYGDPRMLARHASASMVLPLRATQPESVRRPSGPAIEWWGPERFNGRVMMMEVPGQKPSKVVHVPDGEVLCDRCNASIGEFPVAVVNSNALCRECVQKLTCPTTI